jgi:hypothetical protein
MSAYCGRQTRRPVLYTVFILKTEIDTAGCYLADSKVGLTCVYILTALAKIYLYSSVTRYVASVSAVGRGFFFFFF